MKIPEELKKFLQKHFEEAFEVTEYEQRGKDHFLTLDFGDDEEIEITVRERKGDNGNFRITMM
jgi:hypothetical protein